jgi:hypothetical protein
LLNLYHIKFFGVLVAGRFANGNGVRQSFSCLKMLVVFSKQAQKDAKKLKGSPLAAKAKELLELITQDPWGSPPSFEALTGDLKRGLLSPPEYSAPSRPSSAGR